MPAMLPAAVGASALGTGAAIGAGVGGAGLALGTGLAAGTALAGGAGIAGLLGGLGGAGSIAGGALGALAPGVASTIAPAAASQLAGTIGGSVAPGAFGANLAGASQGLIGTAGGVTPGAFGANLAGAGAANPSLASQYAAAQQQAALRSAELGSQTTGMGLQKAYTVSKPGLNPNALQMPSLSNPTVSPLSTTKAANPVDIVGKGIRPNQNFLQNLSNIGSFQDAKDYAEQHPYATAAGAYGLYKALEPEYNPPEANKGMIRPYTYDRTQRPEAYAVSPTQDSSERNYFNERLVAGEPYRAATGGIVSLAVGGPVEQMAAMNAVGANTGYPMANLQTPMYANPAMQRPEATNVIAPSADAGVGAYTGEARFAGGGGVDPRPPFNPNTSGKSAEDYYRSELAGGRRPVTPTAPLPTYTYDPTTLQFTQTSAPAPVTRSSSVGPGGGPAFMGPVGSGHYGAGSYSENARLPGKAAAPMSTPTNVVTGGIATPATGPTQTPSAVPINIPAYQSPEQQLGLTDFYDYMNQQLGGYGGYAKGGNVGGEFHLGDYSDGGRLLKGPGDGVSDSIPASIGGRQPARLADGEFVVPARIVSELGNGSTEAGARKLYAMMDRIQKARKKSVGKNKVAVDSKTERHLPA